MIPKMNDFNQIMQTGYLLLRDNLMESAIIHYVFMPKVVRYLARKYKLETAHENPYKWEDLYLKIKEKLEKEDKELALSLALAWKSAKEMLGMILSDSLFDEELVREDINNIRRFWNRIKNFIKE